MPTMDEHELFDQAFSAPVEPYDVAQPFNADELLDGFTVEEQHVLVDPDSPLGRAMAAARKAWAAPGYVALDPETWKVEPNPVTDVGDE